VLDQILVMLHPFMPFVTEELWSKLGDRADYPLITAKWPEPAAAVDAEAKAEVEWLIELIQKIRATRAELNIPPGPTSMLCIGDPSEIAAKVLHSHAEALGKLARVHEIKFAFVSSGLTAPVLVGADTLQIPLEGVIDVEAERQRLAKALEAVEKEAKSLEGRLSNPNFVERAKPEAVEKARADHAERSAEAERLRAALARLG